MSMPPVLHRFLAAVEARDGAIDPDAGKITAFRDYVDLGEWRARLGDVLGAGG